MRTTLIIFNFENISIWSIFFSWNIIIIFNHHCFSYRKIYFWLWVKVVWCIQTSPQIWQPSCYIVIQSCLHMPAMLYWPFVRGIHQKWWIPLTKGRWYGKSYPVMTTPCYKILYGFNAQQDTRHLWCCHKLQQPMDRISIYIYTMP